MIFRLIGLLLVLASGVSVVLVHAGFALRIVNYAFGFLVMGVFSYLLILFRRDYEKKI